ncbi:MAG: carbonic anhydrase [Rhodospirillaceae bacterium]
MPIERLIKGFKAFRETYYEGKPSFYRSLVDKGQNPDVMVIACSDSRVNPSIIAQAEPGQLFIVRNVANLVPPYQPDSHYHGTSAAIEFAVRDLQVKDVIILGHSHCGGIKHMCEGHPQDHERQFVDGWMSMVRGATETDLTGEEKLRHVEREAVTVSLKNLMTFPWLKERVDAGKLRLHGWIFDLEPGRLFAYSPADGWKSLTD